MAHEDFQIIPVSHSANFALFDTMDVLFEHVKTRWPSALNLTSAARFPTKFSVSFSDRTYIFTSDRTFYI